VIRFPYSVLYNVTAERLRILAIMHHHREPTSWEDRA
jgi:toxin ParE1/3/4